MKTILTKPATPPLFDDDDDLPLIRRLTDNKAPKAVANTKCQKRQVAQRKRRRVRINFWLDLNKPEEGVIADIIAELKLHRAFSSVVRDGILLVSELRQGSTNKLTELCDWLRKPLELWYDLEHGNLDVLLEYFPWVKDKLMPYQSTADISRLQSEVDFLKAMMLAQQGGGITAPKPLTAAPLAPPADAIPVSCRDDDDVLVAVRDESAAGRSTQNFVNSMLALQSAGEKRQ